MANKTDFIEGVLNNFYLFRNNSFEEVSLVKKDKRINFKSKKTKNEDLLDLTKRLSHNGKVQIVKTDAILMNNRDQKFWKTSPVLFGYENNDNCGFESLYRKIISIRNRIGSPIITPESLRNAVRFPNNSHNNYVFDVLKIDFLSGFSNHDINMYKDALCSRIEFNAENLSQRAAVTETELVDPSFLIHKLEHQEIKEYRSHQTYDPQNKYSFADKLSLEPEG